MVACLDGRGSVPETRDFNSSKFASIAGDRVFDMSPVLSVVRKQEGRVDGVDGGECQ